MQLVERQHTPSLGTGSLKKAQANVAVTQAAVAVAQAEPVRKLRDKGTKRISSIQEKYRNGSKGSNSSRPRTRAKKFTTDLW